MDKKGERPSAVDVVKNGLVDAIISGKLQPGDRIPTEPELSERFSVGRNSVREAIKQLQGFGILHIKRADGTFVAERYDQSMLDPMLYGLILEKHEKASFVGLRAVLEVGVLHLAMGLPEVEATLRELAALVDAMESEIYKPLPSVDALLEIDLQFHKTMAGAIGNPMIDSVTSYVARITAPSRRLAIQGWLSEHKEARFLSLHRSIVQVIAARRSESIEQVIQEHYSHWNKMEK